MTKTYRTINTIDIAISSESEAEKVTGHFCDYCLKDTAERFCCPEEDAARCKKEIKKIQEDFGIR